jgi:hypothetical protein
MRSLCSFVEVLYVSVYTADTAPEDYALLNCNCQSLATEVALRVRSAYIPAELWLPVT